MPNFAPNRVSRFARTNARSNYRVFGIKAADRFSHMYVIGKTGTGKTNLLETLVRQDIAAGAGLALLDPHGDLVERVAQSIPAHRAGDVIYFNAPDERQPYGYNPLKHVPVDRRPLAASGMLETFHMQWGERAWGQRIEHVLRNALLALLDQDKATLLDVLRLFHDGTFRKQVGAAVRHEPVRDFWLREFPKYSYRYRADSVAPIQNKVGAFLADPRLHRILTEAKSPISVRRAMDQGKVVLVNLSKGKLGSDSSSLLGGLLVTTIGLAAYSRADLAESERQAFWLYVDEFQSFTTLSVANMLSELRKYRVGMVLAHQYLHQLAPDVRQAVLHNAGTLASFRLGANDAHLIAQEFAPTFVAEDFIGLPNYHIYLKLMIDGAVTPPFSATTLRPDATS